MAQCAALLRRYGVAKIVGDKYAGEWPPARFAEHGIEFEQSARPKSDLYHDFLPLLNARRIELLNLPRLSRAACGLERRTARSGKDSIDHAPGGHDDLANAVAGVLVGLDLDRRQPLIRLNDVFAADGQGAVSSPRPCRATASIVFAVVAMEGADVAVVYCGHDRFKPPLYILDVAAGPLWRDFFTDTAARLDELKRACTAPWMQVFAPTDLVRLFEGAGLFAQAPPDWFDAERSLPFAAGIVSRGADQVLRPRRRQDGDPDHRRGAGVQGRRRGRDGAEDGVHSGDRSEVRPAAHKPAEIPGLSAILKRFRQFANALGDFVARALLAPPHSAVSVCP